MKKIFIITFLSHLWLFGYVQNFSLHDGYPSKIKNKLAIKEFQNFLNINDISKTGNYTTFDSDEKTATLAGQIPLISNLQVLTFNLKAGTLDPINYLFINDKINANIGINLNLKIISNFNLREDPVITQKYYRDKDSLILEFKIDSNDIIKNAELTLIQNKVKDIESEINDLYKEKYISPDKIDRIEYEISKRQLNLLKLSKILRKDYLRGLIELYYEQYKEEYKVDITKDNLNNVFNDFILSDNKNKVLLDSINFYTDYLNTPNLLSPNIKLSNLKNNYEEKINTLEENISFKNYDYNWIDLGINLKNTSFYIYNESYILSKNYNEFIFDILNFNSLQKDNNIKMKYFKTGVSIGLVHNLDYLDTESYVSSDEISIQGKTYVKNESFNIFKGKYKYNLLKSQIMIDYYYLNLSNAGLGFHINPTLFSYDFKKLGYSTTIGIIIPFFNLSKEKRILNLELFGKLVHDKYLLNSTKKQLGIKITFPIKF